MLQNFKKNINKIYQKFQKFLRSKKIIFILAVLLILAFLFTRGAGDKNKIQTAEVEQKDIQSEIVASGKITSQSESTVHSAINGKITWVGVKKGDHINKWQVIAKLDKEEYEIAVRQANQDVVATDAQLQKVYDNLKNQNGVESFNDKIERTTAEAAKNKAVDNLKKAERDLEDTTISSSIDGTVVEININPGDEILVTTELAKVADIENIHFQADVDDTDVANIKEGQDSLITLDAYPDKELKSQVKSISSEGVSDSTGATTFEVTFELPPSYPYRLEMNGEARIITEEKKNVPTVPAEAITDEKYVWVKTDKGFQKKEIVKGIESDTETEIISGLSKDETVAVSGFDQIVKKSLLQKILEII